MKKYIITFKNTHTAMDGETILKEKKIPLSIIPTPTSITKSCGISILINENEFKSVEEIINNKEIEIKNVYLKEEGSYNLVV